MKQRIELNSRIIMNKIFYTIDVSYRYSDSLTKTNFFSKIENDNLEEILETLRIFVSAKYSGVEVKSEYFSNAPVRIMNVERFYKTTRILEETDYPVDFLPNQKHNVQN